MDFVPCEFCDEPVPFDHYMDHARQCTVRRRPQPPIQRTSLVIRDSEDGMIYRVFIDDALRALEASIANVRAGSNQVIDASGSNGMHVETHDDNGNDNDVREDESNDEQEDHHHNRRHAETETDSNDESGGPQEHYIGTPQTHRSLVIVPRILMGPFEPISNADGYEFNTLLSEAIGRVPVGVKDLDSVLIPLVSQPDSDSCPICYDAITDVKTLCGHMYCRPCISKWLSENKACPVCKKDLAEDSSKKIESATQST